MTERQLGWVAVIVALVLLVPLALYLPWLLIGLVLAVWMAGSVRRRLFRTHPEEGLP